MNKWIGLWTLMVCFLACSEDEKADTIKLSATVLSYESEGGEQGVLIQSSADWTVKPADAWCFVQPDKEKGQFAVVVTENEDFAPRMTVLKLEAGNCVQEIDVLQEGKRGDLVLSANKGVAYDLNDNYAVVVTSKYPWTASELGNWLTAEPASGEAGSTVVRIRFSANVAPAERQGAIIFESANSESQRFELVQEGALPDGREQDSLALLKIYDAIGGDQLKELGYLKNWKVGPLENWDKGMMSEDGRVYRLMLPQLPLYQTKGYIPEEIKYLTRLRDFGASYSGLGGTLPDGFGRCINLETLVVAYTQDYSGGEITGELPVRWCALSKLSQIVLDYNKLEGGLPLEYANMSSLLNFIVSGNNLSGTLPAVWSNISTISQLELASNHFVGEIPEEWDVWRNITILDVTKNSGLYGELSVVLQTTARNNGGAVRTNGTNIILK